jgi:quercetin dioxygenase-like cupin family protein
MSVHRALAATSWLIATGLALADDAHRVDADVLVQSTGSWNGKPFEAYPQGQPELTVVRMTIPPNTTLPWHKHSMPNAAYILSGHLTVEDRTTGEKRVVRTGEAFIEQVGAEHRGFTDDEACVVVVTYAGTPGMPRSIVSPGEKSDH